MYLERKSEKQYLEQIYEKSSNDLVIVYGKKGVGKTTFVRNFSQNKNAFYYCSKPCSDREQNFWIAESLKALNIKIKDYPDYSDIIPAYVNSLTDNRKAIFIIDEFHFMLKNNSDMLNKLLESFNSLDSGKKVLVILISSSIGWIENDMISRIGKAALSLSALIKIHDFSFADIKAVYPDVNRDLLLKYYSILGGNLLLWNSLDLSDTFENNMNKNILSPTGFIFGYMTSCLNEDLRELSVYYTILASLSRGLYKLNDIFIHTGFSRPKISVYIKNLMELEIVEKIFSYETNGYENTQKGIYRICNNPIRFYFYYIFPHLNEFSTMPSSAFSETYIRDSFGIYMEEAYRECCKEDIVSLTHANVGEWVGKSGNIDIIAKRETGDFLIALCKYSAVISENDLEWLMYCAKEAKVTPGLVYLFSEAGFDEKVLTTASENRERIKLINNL